MAPKNKLPDVQKFSALIIGHLELYKSPVHRAIHLIISIVLKQNIIFCLFLIRCGAHKFYKMQFFTPSNKYKLDLIVTWQDGTKKIKTFFYLGSCRCTMYVIHKA